MARMKIRIAEGLSPRVRGNLARSALPGRVRRSIPACAGEPTHRSHLVAPLAVYPRVCGGTASQTLAYRRDRGLSPRVRGNRRAGRPGHARRRSIPACAGEPRAGEGAGVVAKVYPRVCGGTVNITCAHGTSVGLSPRVRGNRGFSGRRAGWSGSIPACAGEPLSKGWRSTLTGVYPRVCGGTILKKSFRASVSGLSPRVRGNPAPRMPIGICDRSIPACAGEPWADRSAAVRKEVYPRVCGGTLTTTLWTGLPMGLSPRVRGNRRHSAGSICAGGSIPACAGEPLSARAGYRQSPVYPRVCGGTGLELRRRPRTPGLSPRVRGNLFAVAAPLGGAGSIPACAGEPRPIALLGGH